MNTFVLPLLATSVLGVCLALGVLLPVFALGRADARFLDLIDEHEKELAEQRFLTERSSADWSALSEADWEDFLSEINRSQKAR